MTHDEPHKRRWQAVAFLFAAFALCYVDRQAVFSIFPVLQKELGFSSAQLGLVGSLFVWSYALTMPLAGRLADIVRRDRLLIASLVIWSISTLGTALSGSVATFLGWRVMMGLTESLYFPAAMAILATLHPGPTRSRALSIHQSAQLLGIVAGGWYGGWAAEQIGWRHGFVALCFVGMGYALVLLFFFRKIPFAPAKVRPVSEGSRRLLHSPLFLLLAATLFVFAVSCGLYTRGCPTCYMSASGFRSAPAASTQPCTSRWGVAWVQCLADGWQTGWRRGFARHDSILWDAVCS